MTTTSPAWTEESVEVAGNAIFLRRAGTGAPVLLLHHEIGDPGPQQFDAALAERFTVYVPSHPGFGRSDRPAWMRSVRDVAVAYQWLLKNLGLDHVSLLGLGFGGWIAAEMASMAPRQFARLALVAPLGIKPDDGDILDQALYNHIDYAHAGFHDPTRFEALFGAEPSSEQLEQWEINREMAFRIAWKPYMYSQTLPHLLGGVDAPALIVWPADDRIVPPSTAVQWQRALPNARLATLENCGHFADLERPAELAALVAPFLAGA